MITEEGGGQPSNLKLYPNTPQVITYGNRNRREKAVFQRGIKFRPKPARSKDSNCTKEDRGEPEVKDDRSPRAGLGKEFETPYDMQKLKLAMANASCPHKKALLIDQYHLPNVGQHRIYVFMRVLQMIIR